MKKYTITVTEDQLRLISDCIEDVSRFASGQWEMQNTIDAMVKGLPFEEKMRKTENARKFLRSAKKELLPKVPDNGSITYNGTEFIGNTYQIYRTIKYHLTREAGISNAYSSPALESGSMGRVEIERIDVPAGPSDFKAGQRVRVFKDDPMDDRLGIAHENRWHIGDEFVIASVQSSLAGTFLDDGKGHNLNAKRAEIVE